MRICIIATVSAVLLSQAAFTPFEPYQPATLTATATLVNAAADYDGDQDPDLFVGFAGTSPNRLYRNDAGTLTDVAAEAGVADQRATRAAAWGDMDADADADLLVGFAPGSGSVLRLYRNDSGRFTDVTTTAGLLVDGGAVRQLAWVDIDGDADLDLFVAFRDRANALYRNDAGRFTDAAGALGLADARRTVGAVWFDYDQDGDLDLYAGNMDGDTNALYRNDGARFTDVAESAGLQWGGRKPSDPAHGTVRPCAADVNGDGLFDILTANYGPLGLFLNKGAGHFDDVSAAWGVRLDGRYDTCAFADIDHDGRLDLYVNGTVTGGVSYRDDLFRNTGSRFEDLTPAPVRAIDADHGAAWMDVDADGDLDLALTGAGKTPIPLVLRSLLPAPVAGRSLAVRVLDARGRAVLPGAEVRLYAAGTRRRLGARLVDSGSGYNSQNDLPVHFGLAVEGRVDVEVTWPNGTARVTQAAADVDPAGQGRRPLVVRVGSPRPDGATRPAGALARTPAQPRYPVDATTGRAIGASEMAPEEVAKRRLAGGQKTVIIDVRPTEAFERASLPGAIHIPLADLEKPLPEFPKDTLLVFT